MRVLTVCLAFAACVSAPAMLQAGNDAAPRVEVEAPWMPAPPKAAPVIGGYATIINRGSTADRLLGASTPVAATAEVHAMTMNNGLMHMERLREGLVIPPGTTITLAPGGNHLMFLQPTRQIKEGQAIAGTMLFEKAGAVPVTFAVGSIGASAAPGVHATSDTAGPKM